MTAAATRPRLDRRLHAFRHDLAAASLRGLVEAPRYVEGEIARVLHPVVPLRERPAMTESLVNEVLFGEVVRVFDVVNGWAWVQLERDGYVGYAAGDALWREPLETTHRVASVGTFVYPVPDIKAPPLMHLSLGAELVVETVDDRFASLKTGGFVVNRHIAERDRFARDFVEIAERFIGTPYLWGGRTRLGLDCSGLLQLALEAAGVMAPRDSDMQQAVLGSEVLIPADLEGLLRGDLIFWPDHVGVMVDSGMLLHANAHHMAVAVEPISTATRRNVGAGSRIVAVKRLDRLSA